MIRITRNLGAADGLFIAPEGVACFAAVEALLDPRKIGHHERIVLFDTGSGISTSSALSAAVQNS